MSTNKKIDLVFYGDFGLRIGKGEEVLETAKALFKESLLGKVYVRDKGLALRTEFERYIISPIPGGSFLPRILALIKKFFLPSFQSRIWGERLFDYFTSQKLKKESQIIYMTTGSSLTLKKAKKLGFKVGLHCGVLHPSYILDLIKEEFSKFNLVFKSQSLINSLRDYQKNLSLADFIVVHSNFAKENYIQYGVPPEKIFVNPLGINLEEFKPIPLTAGSKKEKIFIFIGGVVLLKGVHYLLEAWKQLNLKDAKLIVCGNKEMDDWLLVKKYWRLPNVEFPGFVNPKDYYHKALAFVFPSLTEGFSRVVGEALASGLPVVTTPVAAHLVRDGIDGFIIPIRDIEAIKEKILYFYNNLEKAIEMGNSARQRAEEFTWQAYRENFLKIIRNFL